MAEAPPSRRTPPARQRAAATRPPPAGAGDCARRGATSRRLRAPASSSALDQLELDGQRDVIGEREAALGQRGVPLEAVLSPVDRRLERQSETGLAGDVDVRPGDLTAGTERMCVALDRQLTLQGHGVALAADVGRPEAQLRVLLDVEEIRGAEVGLEVLVRDAGRPGLDGAGEPGSR